MTRTATDRPAKRRRPPGWVPDQHGAWAMLVVPLVLGIVAAGPAWVHVPLALTWLLGYFAFYAGSLWLKSRFKARYLPPLRTYGLVLLVPAAVVLVAEPGLLVWGLAYVPLIAVSLWCSYRRRDRSILNDVVTVFAACLMLPVAYDAGVDATGADWPAVWGLCAVVTGYFVGTVLYVKTLIREKGKRSYLVASVLYHLVMIAAVAVVLAAVGLPWIPTTLVFAVLLVRAVLVPRTGARPVQVGLGEMLATVVLTGVLLFAWVARHV